MINNDGTPTIGMPNEDRLSLSLLSRELRSLTGGEPPGYRRLYGFVVDGRIPAVQDNGRWYIRRADLPAITRLLGLSLAGGDIARAHASS